jgi:hypothetical protein
MRSSDGCLEFRFYESRRREEFELTLDAADARPRSLPSTRVKDRVKAAMHAEPRLAASIEAHGIVVTLVPLTNGAVTRVSACSTDVLGRPVVIVTN